MDIDEKTDSKRLENLAISFAAEFVKETRKNPQEVISLYGHDLGILNSIKGIMESYFKQNGAEISVEFGREGYSVDVGYFLN